MSSRFVLLCLAVVLTLLAAFTLQNLQAVTGSTVLQFAFWSVEAPLGAILLGFTGLTSIIFLTYILALQANILLESRRLAKEVREQRDLADKAEASRFTELRQLIESGWRAHEASAAESNDALLKEMSRILGDSQRQADESSSGLAAHLGEIEDKLDSTLQAMPHRGGE